MPRRGSVVQVSAGEYFFLFPFSTRNVVITRVFLSCVKLLIESISYKRIFNGNFITRGTFIWNYCFESVNVDLFLIRNYKIPIDLIYSK